MEQGRARALGRSVLPLLIAAAVLYVLARASIHVPFFAYLMCIVGVNIVLAVSLNIVNGMTGQFSLGHAGFMAVGAYAAAKVSIALQSTLISGLPVVVSDQVLFLVATLAGGAVAALAGFVVGLPSLRLRGDYLAIVTLGFGEILRVVVQNTPSLGGALGLGGTPQHASLFSIGLAAFVCVLIARRLAASAQGRALIAIREDEVAAEAMGVNTTAFKVRAFVISSFFAGVAGALFAHFVPIINPGSFTFVKSIEVVVMVVAGGLGSTSGAIGAAIVLTLLPEGLRSLLLSTAGDSALAQRVDQIRMPLYGVLLVLLMLWRPQGLLGSRELWDQPWLKRLWPGGVAKEGR